MLSGVVEMVCRIIVIAVTLNPFGYWAVRLASPITWLFTGILLIVTYFIWEKQSRKNMPVHQTKILVFHPTSEQSPQAVSDTGTPAP